MAISREVLVLNRGWQPLRIASFKDAMGALTTCHPDGTPKARIIDPVSFQQFTWDDWSQLTIEEGEDRIHGAMKDFKVPEVIVLTRYDKIHTQRNFNRRTLFRRDDFQCFVPSTQILMADCSLKPICEIKIGDKILDAFGKEQIVEFVHCRQAVPDEMISIKHRGNGDPLFCTMDHKILDFSWKDGSQVNLEGCQAGSLGLNSYLAEIIPEIPIGNKKIDLYELAKENIKHIKLIDGMVKHYSGNPVIRYINLNNDLGKLCGYFLSEGCIHKTHVSFSLNGKTEISYANEIMSLLKIIFGVSSTWDVDGNRGVVICCSTIVRLFFLTFFGKKDDKHIGIKYNREFLEGVLYGVCRGDATYNSDQSRCSVQMSRVELIKEIYIISLMLGFRPSLSKTGFRSDGRIYKGVNFNAVDFNAIAKLSIVPYIEWEPSKNNKTDRKVHGNHLISKITEIKKIDYVGEVYDLQVSGSHTYIANFVCVHNCQYCGSRPGSEELTLEHIIPKSRGGKTNWENVVCACVDCNSLKADKTPEEAGMKLRSKPKKPIFPVCRQQVERCKTWAHFISEAYWSVPLENDM